MARAFQQGDQPISGYRLDRLLGRGRLGEVWETTSPSGNRLALKIIRLAAGFPPEDAYWLRELQRVRHAHLNSIIGFWLQYEDGVTDYGELLEAGEEAQYLLLATSLADGNLASKLNEYRGKEASGIPAEELLRYFSQAAMAIDFLNTPRHLLEDRAEAIPHGCIQPSNLLLVGNSIQLSDFGLWKILEGSTSSFPAYIAPEVLNHGKPGRWSDQYSLAISYYYLRTGEWPFSNSDASVIFAESLDGKLNFKLLSPAEQQVLRRATAKRPEERYPNCQELVLELQRSAAKAKQQPFEAPRYKTGTELVPGYKLERLLGHGADGEVWEGTAPGKLPVALKIIRDIDRPNSRGMQEFRALEILHRVTHPGLLELRAYWLLDRQGRVLSDDTRDAMSSAVPHTLVIATRLAEKTLTQLLEEFRKKGQMGIPATELISYFRHVASALDYLNTPQHKLATNRVSIIHRDVKPDNMMLIDHMVKLSDFGLAKVMEQADITSEINQHSVGYTFHFAAPEVLRGKVTKWSDQYSLGISYYFLRTGRYPIPPDCSAYESMMRYLEGKLELAGLPEAEKQVLKHAISVVPQERFDSCSAFIEAMENAVSLGTSAVRQQRRVVHPVPVRPLEPAPVPPQPVQPKRQPALLELDIVQPLPAPAPVPKPQPVFVVPKPVPQPPPPIVDRVFSNPLSTMQAINLPALPYPSPLPKEKVATVTELHPKTETTVPPFFQEIQNDWRKWLQLAAVFVFAIGMMASLQMLYRKWNNTPYVQVLGEDVAEAEKVRTNPRTQPEVVNNQNNNQWNNWQPANEYSPTQSNRNSNNSYSNTSNNSNPYNPAPSIPNLPPPGSSFGDNNFVTPVKHTNGSTIFGIEPSAVDFSRRFEVELERRINGLNQPAHFTDSENELTYLNESQLSSRAMLFRAEAALEGSYPNINTAEKWFNQARQRNDQSGYGQYIEARIKATRRLPTESALLLAEAMRVDNSWLSNPMRRERSLDVFASAAQEVQFKTDAKSFTIRVTEPAPTWTKQAERLVADSRTIAPALAMVIALMDQNRNSGLMVAYDSALSNAVRESLLKRSDGVIVVTNLLTARADVYANQRQNEKALSDFHEAWQLIQQRRSTLSSSSPLAIHNKVVAPALRLGANSNYPDQRRMLGNLYAAQGSLILQAPEEKWPTAFGGTAYGLGAEAYTKAIGLSGDSGKARAELLYGRAQCLLRLAELAPNRNSLKQCQEDAEQITRLDPTFHGAYNLAGQIRYQNSLIEGNADVAINSLNKAMEEYSTAIERAQRVRENESTARYLSNRSQATLQLAKLQLGRSNNDPRMLSQGKQALEAARKDAADATRFDTVSEPAWEMLGQAYEAMANKNLGLQEQSPLLRAEEAYRKHLDVQPSSMVAAVNLGRVLVRQVEENNRLGSKIQEADRLLREVLTRQPNQPEANYWMGRVQLLGQQARPALSSFSKAVRHPTMGARYLEEILPSFSTQPAAQLELLDSYIPVDRNSRSELHVSPLILRSGVQKKLNEGRSGLDVVTGWENSLGDLESALQLSRNETEKNQLRVALQETAQNLQRSYDEAIPKASRFQAEDLKRKKGELVKRRW